MIRKRTFSMNRTYCCLMSNFAEDIKALNIYHFIKGFSLALMLVFCLMPETNAQINLQGRQDMLEGNRLFEQGDYAAAEQSFRRAIENNAGPQAKFNLGNALYRQGRLDEAKEIFESTEQFRNNPDLLSGAFYNKGNIQLEQEKIVESIESFKNALRLNPRDEDARYNLAYALSKLQQQPPPPPDGNGEDEDDQDDEQQDGEGQADAGEEGQEDDQQQDGDNQDEEREQDAQADADGSEDENQEQEQEQEQQAGMSREDMERILEALDQREEDLQQKWLEEQAQPADRTIEKDW